MCSRYPVDVTGECNSAELEGSGKKKQNTFCLAEKYSLSMQSLKKKNIIFAAKIWKEQRVFN